MNSTINYNTRFTQERESNIGEGIEGSRFAKSEVKSPGDAQSSDMGDAVLHRSRAKNSY
jgi:hypothetical protein